MPTSVITVFSRGYVPSGFSVEFYIYIFYERIEGTYNFIKPYRLPCHSDFAVLGLYE